MNTNIMTFRRLFLLAVGTLFLGAFFISLSSEYQATRAGVEQAHAQEPTNQITGWLWNGRDEDGNGVLDGGAGWISLHCENQGECNTSNYGLNVDPTTGDISGYAWAGNGYGWVSFNRSDAGAPPNGASGALARIDDGELVGWARFLNHGDGWSGWIRFDGVDVSQDGDITGYAWNGDDSNGDGTADNGFGWLRFVEAHFDGDLGGNPDNPLSVVLTANPSSGQPPLPSTLMADVGGGSEGYEYQFVCDSEDGEPREWGNPQDSDTFSCRYEEEGLYTAWVRVTDADGNVETRSTNINVCAVGNCQLLCYAENGSGAVLGEDNDVLLGETVRWVVENTDGTDVSGDVVWDFGNPAPNVLNGLDLSSVEVMYTTVGIKEARASLLGGNEASCNAGFRVIADPEFVEF